MVEFAPVLGCRQGQNKRRSQTDAGADAIVRFSA